MWTSPSLTLTLARAFRRLLTLSSQDKACMDLTDVDLSLECLPVFLAGCRKLLVLAGVTYSNRLWYDQWLRSCAYPHSPACLTA